MLELRRVDHVGVIVDDLDDAARLLLAFGLEPDEATERDDLRVAFFRCGDMRIEIIEPVEPALRRERLGEGCSARIEHVAFEVADLERTMEALQALGVRPNGPPLHHAGRSMFWTDPGTSDGMMFQFVQLPAERADAGTRRAAAP